MSRRRHDEETDASSEPARSSAPAFEGDRFNRKGERCSKCGVVIEDGPELEQRTQEHAALHDEG